jgi:hypothetical protein
MIKILAAVVFLLGTVIFMLVPVYSQDDVAIPADTSEAVPANDTYSADEETLPAEEGVGEGVVTGDVTVLDATASSITIKGADGVEKAFSVVDGETILWKGIEDIKLSDIKKGDKAEVGYYTDDAGKLIASWVDVIVPEQPAAAGAQTPPASQAAPTAAVSDEE